MHKAFNKRNKEVLRMKRMIVVGVMLLFVCIMSGCGKKNNIKSEPTQNINSDTEYSTLGNQSEQMNEDNTCTISGSFTVYVRDVMPDYIEDDTTPNIAVVTEFQESPFTVYVGEKIGKELIANQNATNAYVFTIEPICVKGNKDDIQNMKLSSIVWEYPIKITECRVAKEDEIGMDSLQLSFE